MFLSQLLSVLPQIAIFAILAVGLVLATQRFRENAEKYRLLILAFGCLMVGQLLNIISNIAIPWIISSDSAISIPALMMIFTLPAVLLIIAGYAFLIVGIFRR